MKTFEQLNDSELVSLNQEQIDWYIKLKKAEAGVKIINCPEFPSYQSIPEPDLQLYGVAGRYFTTPEKANQVASAINVVLAESFSVDYNWHFDSKHKYASPYSGNLESVEIVRVYSRPVYDSIKDILASNKKIQEAYEKFKREYDDEDEKSTEIVDSIYEAINKAKERLEQFRNFKTRIIEYLQLADGNRDIAWNFFDKAYAVEPSVKTMIMESQEYQEAIKSYIEA